MSRLYLFLFFIVCLLSCQACWCQDLIFKKNGDTITAKVLRVDPYSVDYKKTSDPDSSVLSISKSYINYIRYKNGTADTFKVTDIQSDPGSHIYKGNYYGEMRLDERGKEDARKYYKKYKGPKRFAVFSVIIPYGLIPDLCIFFTPPKEHNLGCPYPELMLKQEYRSAYKKKAFQIKKRQTANGVLIGYGIVTGVALVLAGGLLLAYSH